MMRPRGVITKFICVDIVYAYNDVVATTGACHVLATTSFDVGALSLDPADRSLLLEERSLAVDRLVLALALPVVVGTLL